MRAREQVFLASEDQARSGQGPQKHRPPGIRPAQPASFSLLSQRRENGGIQQGWIYYDDITRPGYAANAYLSGAAGGEWLNTTLQLPAYLVAFSA